MPLNTDLNVSPYFDDYDANNQYYRILFRPSTAVQARELTQVQSMLQNQIESFGNWAFKNGDIVTGCTIIDIPSLPFIRLQDFQTNGAPFSISNLVNTQVVSASSNLTARVFYSNSGFSANYPNTNVIYVQYVNTGNNNVTEFSNNETLNFYSIPSNGTPIAVINSYANSNTSQISTGNAHGISVSDGVVFLNGTFVKVLNPTFGIVNNFGTYAGNNVVGFQLIEEIVTENQDSSLLDNALGSSNENAPGAHRMKLIPSIVTIDPASVSSANGFNPIATYNYGGLVTKTTSSNVYSVVGDAIAKRIYDEAGNYVVNPFVVDTVTNLTGNSVVTSLDANSVIGRISPGVGYSQGERVEILKTAYITMRRGVDTKVFSSQQITFNYGGYFTINEVAGVFPFTNAETINLYDSYQKAVTNRTFASTNPIGNVIGTASVRCFSYNSGVPGANTAQYILHVFNIKMVSGFQVNQIKSVYYGSGTKAVADVLSNGLVSTSTQDQLYSFGQKGLKNLRNASNNVNTEYAYRTLVASNLTTSGNAVFTITSSATGGTDILPYGIGTLPSADAATFTLVATQNVDSSALSGSVTISNTTNIVTGSLTNFLNDFAIGDLIKANNVIRTVSAVTNATYMTVDSPFSSIPSASGLTYYKSYVNGKIIPFAYSATGVPSGSVYITNSTSFSINTSQAPSSTLGVEIYFDVLRTQTSPATKNIRKNRFVKINVGNNAAGPSGPWCLGISDIHQITAIYGSGDGSYTTSGTNLTNLFNYDTGQKDTHYDLGYLYSSGGYNPTQYPYLLVQLDYFTTNNNSGCGFFTVESYPVNDSAVTSNTILTKDIPLYVDEQGTKLWLRDYVDFRPVATSSANNTGDVDTSNSALVTTAISYASVNPASTLTFSPPAGGFNVPSYGRNLQSDFTMYLPRQDLITITPDNVIKVIEGLSSTAPQSPIFPDNSMAVAVINVPPYPSLSTDQVDSDQSINKKSKNLIRDTSTAISTSLVTNRRYTMSDIGKLDKRISNLEYYTQLSLLQQQASNLVVTDQNGLNRFKNGIFAESFNDFTLSDVSNPEYSIAIDQKKGEARPKFVLETFKFNFNQSISSSIQKTGRAITLPYSNAVFINQPYATKYRSSAHVASHWNGIVTLMPTYNNNIDQNQTASVGTTINNATPWQQFANSPFGSVWGGWQTTTNSVSNTVTTGTANVYNVELGYQYTQDTAQAALDAAIAKYTSEGYVIGGTSLTFTGRHGGIGSNASVTQVS